MKFLENILEIKKLKKIYDGRTIVDELSFNLQFGHILAFLGPNGAGKSTTINMISTLTEPDSGKILFKGKDVKDSIREFKSSIGVVPQSLAIYEDLSAYQNLKFFASLYNIPSKKIQGVCCDALEFVGLSSFADRKAGTFSGGMKRRLNIACSLVNNPELIILDEPTVGIDPQSRKCILDSIKKIEGQGVSVVYTTHYMEEVEAIAEDVIIIDRGKVLISDTIDNIKTKFQGKSFVDIKIDRIDQGIESIIRTIKGVNVREIKNNTIMMEINIIENSKVINDIMKIIINNNHTILNINSKNKNLEDIFLELTGSKLRD